MGRTKAAAMQEFFSGFGVPAYSSAAVPEGAEMPYITYAPVMGAWGDEASVQADLWYRTESEAAPNAKVAEMSEALGLGGVVLPCEGGAIWVKRGSPWAQSVPDADNSVKRRYLNFDVEHLTTY